MKMLVRCAMVAAVLGGVACAAFGQSGKRPMTFADMQAMKRVSDPQISPSGKWVLFSVTDVSLEKNSKTNHLWVVPLNDGGTTKADSSAPLRNDKQERQLTTGSGETNGRFSPDGKWVMYSAADNDGKGEIFVAQWFEDTGTMGAGRRVTGLETEADGAIWAPDSKHFLFVSNVYPECESHAAMGAARNDEEAACNALKDAAADKNPVKALVFDHLLYRHWTAYQGAKHSHIFYGSTDWDEKHQPLAPTDLTPASVVGDHEAPTFQLGAPLGYAISPDGREVAYVTNLDEVPAASTNNDIFVVQVGAEPKTAKKVSTSPGSDDGPAYSPDGKWLAWRSQARNGYESDKFDLVVMDRGTRKINNLTTTFNNWVDEFAWTPDSGTLSFASPRDGEERIYITSLQGERGLLQGKGEYSDLRWMALSPKGRMGSNRQLIAVQMAVDAPPAVVVIGEYDSGQPTTDGEGMWNTSEYDLTHLNWSILSQIELTQLEPFWFEGAAGTQVEGFTVKPPNFDPAKKYPVKFLMHGGPQTQWGDAWSYRWNPELFAADGYVIVMVNRRGSTGYGQKFVEEISGDWGGKAFVDLMKGLDYAEKTFPFIDKDRECALGASYGGYMADWVLTHTDRFKCIVTHDGMYNSQSAYGTTEEIWFNEWEFRPLVKSGGGEADPSAPLRDDNKKSANEMVEQTKPAQPWDYFDKPKEEDPFRKYSPMQYIKNAHTPTLIVHSQKDYRLDVSEGFQMFTALQRLGVPSKMLYFPDEGHWVLKPQNSQLWNETVNDWCDRWLGMGKYKDVGPEKNPVKQGIGKTRGK